MHAHMLSSSGGCLKSRTPTNPGNEVALKAFAKAARCSDWSGTVAEKVSMFSVSVNGPALDPGLKRIKRGTLAARISHLDREDKRT